MGFHLCWHCRTPFNPNARPRFCCDECQAAWWEGPVRDLGEGEHVLLATGRAALPAAEIMSDRWGALTFTDDNGRRVGVEPGMRGLRGVLRARVLDAAPSAMPDRPTTSAWPPAAPGDVIDLGTGAVFTEHATGDDADIAVGVRPAWSDPRLGWLHEAQALRVCGARIALELHAAEAPGLHTALPENHAGAPGPSNATGADGIAPWRADYRVRIAALLESLAAEHLQSPHAQDGETFTICEDYGSVAIAAPSDEEYRRLIGGAELDGLAGAAKAIFTGGADGWAVQILAVCGDARFRLDWTAGAEAPDLRTEDWPSPLGRFPDYLADLTAPRPRRARRLAPEPAPPEPNLLVALIEAIPAGRWTTFADIGKAAGGIHPRKVRHVIDYDQVPGAHRVLLANGKPGRREQNDLPDNRVALLREEGVRFSATDSADPTQRLHSDDLRQLTRT